MLIFELWSMYNTFRPYFILIFYFDKSMCRTTNKNTYDKKYSRKNFIFVKRFFFIYTSNGTYKLSQTFKFLISVFIFYLNFTSSGLSDFNAANSVQYTDYCSWNGNQYKYHTYPYDAALVLRFYLFLQVFLVFQN